MNSTPPAPPRLRCSVVFQHQPDQIPHLPCQMDSMYRIILLSSGSAAFFIDHKVYSVQTGDVLICRPQARYAILPSPDGIFYTALSFEIPSFADVHALPLTDVFHCGSQFQELLSLSGMLLLPSSQPAVRAHLLSALLLQISTCRNASPQHIIQTDSPAYMMSRFIDEHYTEDIFLSDIARSAHITPSHAIHVFKPVFGVSPVQHLNNRRIGQAQHLLATTDLSASQIASMVGIGNINYFYTVFKKLSGQSPASYRAYLHDKTMYFPD